MVVPARCLAEVLAASARTAAPQTCVGILAHKSLASSISASVVVRAVVGLVAAAPGRVVLQLRGALQDAAQSPEVVQLRLPSGLFAGE